MFLRFRPAQIEDQDTIWEILQGAIQRRKEDGSEQWQDGYP
ncbi:MAG: GNAT family N-acetyltransferase, partial [Sphingobacteriales bacterium]